MVSRKAIPKTSTTRLRCRGGNRSDFICSGFSLRLVVKTETQDPKRCYFAFKPKSCQCSVLGHNKAQKEERDFLRLMCLLVRLPFHEIYDKKEMKAERNKAANTLRGTLLLRMANSRTLAKHRVHYPLKAPCLHLAIRDFNYQKPKERALSLPGKLPAPSILVNFALRFGSGSPLPLN